MIPYATISRTLHLPQWAIDIIANPPKSGEGFHLWLFRAARALWKCGRNGNDIREILEIAAATCGRHVSAQEIKEAVENSQTSAFQPAGAQRRPWPRVNCEQREAIIASGNGLVDLWETSPVRFEDNAAHTEQIIDALFPGNPLLCCASTTAIAQTAKREEWSGRMSRLQLTELKSPISDLFCVGASRKTVSRCRVKVPSGIKDANLARRNHLCWPWRREEAGGPHLPLRSLGKGRHLSP